MAISDHQSLTYTRIDALHRTPYRLECLDRFLRAESFNIIVEELPLKSRRRSILQGGAALAAASMLPGRTVANTADVDSEFARAHALLQQSLVDQFSEMGYLPVGAAPIVTGEEFNGGLRFDETGLIEWPGQMTIQHCTRLEDIDKKERRDVLPLFHIFRCNRPYGFKPQQSLAQVLAYLTGSLGLDVSRLSLVSGPRLEEYGPVLKRVRIETGRQVYMRDEAEARANADGSGYWRFPGDADAEPVATVGIYCWIGDGPPRQITQYPPSEDWTEIGEALLEDTDSLGFALGTERLTLATTGQMPSWQNQLPVLFEAIENDRRDGEVPSGKAYFARN